MKNPTVLLRIGGSFYALTEKGELAEAPELDGTPDWGESGLVDPLDCPEAAPLTWQALVLAEKAARGLGYDVFRMNP